MMVKTSIRLLLVFAFDLLAVVVAWLGGFSIRFNFTWPYGYGSEMAYGLLLLLCAQVLACRWAGLYRGMWRFASLSDLKRVLKAVSVSTFVLLVVMLFSKPHLHIPRSLVVLYPILLLLLMSGGRVAWRMWKEYSLYGRLDGQGKPVVIVGAGTAGAMLLRELERTPEWDVVALVDDDQAKQGLELSGCRVEGRIQDLTKVLKRHDAKHVILAMPSARSPVLRSISEAASKVGALLFTIPALDELMSGRVAINVMRPVKIEDLLGRQPVRIDTDNVKTMLTGKTVLVTGAGGSIGSELCRQLAKFAPSKVVLVEANEFALYMIEQWFREEAASVEIVPLAGDVRDEDRMNEIFGVWQPQVVFHAAAYKHVPLMEVGNAWQAVRNNVFGTLVVGRCAQRHGAKRFVLISTDKAVNPTNVMGATKRMAEMICEVLHCQNQGTLFQMVRFGNVLGSTGSVIPKFQAQIARGGPVTVTHPDINRYFMSIPEAAQLVLQAAAMGKGGEIFVLDMGEPVKIVDLARNMIRLSGYSEDEIRIKFTGLRPGEKLYEELLADAEETVETPHEKLRIARSRSVPDDFFAYVQAWQANKDVVDDNAVRTELKRWIPEYTPMKQ
ncbi:polysaccharide biosynthesis protein [Pollutimonas harenae]|uniref:Polysaccharide biosynthesis protein n=1 Tax=Pollutimonas harenae TaxID=657015 RepID=A0A853GQ85_9BURK|nr:nucleoside-diphosphate sugar epimerase/dehydratase [Pollutimonas harenae]NYT84327.1 polysaccharide biosynthesis protein [Pollutimonas harenae]TEA73271.1 polysaccharide biosynthesis protein [Pollutimonas harenae]